MSRRAVVFALSPLFVGLFVAAALISWHGLVNCDCRTYLEMIRGVLAHGLPFTDNGGAAINEFPELRARWNSAVDNHLWGMYGPAYAYLAAPAFWLDGVRGVLRFNVLTLAAGALGTYRLARVLVDDARLAIAAAYLLVIATPAWGMVHEVSAYTLLWVAMVWGNYFLCTATSAAPARGRAAAGGVCLGLAMATHVMVAPLVAVALVVLIAVADKRDRARLWPAAFTGVALGLVPLIAINLLRFGTPNPLAAAPCTWQSCEGTGVARQQLGAIVRFAGGVLAVAAMAFVALLVVWRRGLGARLAVIGLALVLLLAPSALRAPTLAMLRLLAAFVFDVGILNIPTQDFFRPADGRGYLMLDFALKSALECSPFLVLGLLARRRTASDEELATAPPNDRLPLALLAAQIAALFVVLALRAEMNAAYAIGFPLLNLRYTFCVLPLAVVLSMVAIDRLARDTKLTLPSLATLVFAAVLTAVLWRGTNDQPTWRRVVELRATLVTMVLALVALLVWRARPTARWAIWGIVPAVAIAIAITIGVDLRATILLRDRFEQTFVLVDKYLPQRAALIGHAVVLDPSLGALATRDLEYADVYESRSPDSLHRLIQHWLDDKRPVFAIIGGKKPESPYPDLRFNLLDRRLGIVQITSINDQP